MPIESTAPTSSYLTGFDPRFEEAMMILAVDRPPAILAGNECAGLAGSAPVPMRVHLFQDFSLPGQPRDRSLPLEEILAREGVHAASSVGVIGWKSYSTPGAIEVPAFIVDALRRLVGTAGRVENVNEMMINAADGLRVINEVEQLAAFEYAACHTSQGVRNLLFNLEIGMRENDAVQLLQWNGMPLSCHLMLTAGERATHGLLSPRDRPFERGDRFTVAFGIWGSVELPRRVPGRAPPTSYPPVSRTMSTSSSARTSRPSSNGTKRFTLARRVPSFTRSSSVASAIRSSGSSSIPDTRSTSTSG